MADASYDAVIIGGGHNGLILGLYLQKAGMEVAVLERQMEIGGGCCGDEVPLPGFLANTCSTNTRVYLAPVFEDFHLKDFGVKHVFPQNGQGMVFDDETCLVTYPANPVVSEDPVTTEFNQENVDKTLKEIARFSERDAETAANFIERYQRGWGRAYRRYMFNPPAPWGEKDALEELLDDPKYGVDPRWPLMSSADLGSELYESDEMRCYFMRAVQTSTGVWPDTPLGLYNLVHSITISLSLAVPAFLRGGTHTFAHALQRALVDLGGKFFVLSEVDKVIIENGQAKGVRLVDGSEVRARKLVACNVDTNQAIFRFVGEEYVSPAVARKVKTIRYSGMQSYWAYVALHELPKYKAASFNPDCDTLPRTFQGPKDPFYLAEMWKPETYVYGIPNKLCWFSGCDDIWDPSRTPEGKHLVIIEQYCAPFRSRTEKEWRVLRRRIFDVLFEQWPIYAPNMTWDNVIDVYVDTPWETSHRNIDMIEGDAGMGAQHPFQLGRFRPIPEFAQYRLPVKNLYICSANTHPGSGVRCACGYNAYKVIAEDFGLPKPWEEKGREW
jgi:phytoene dehydrogenase-like protein